MNIANYIKNIHLLRFSLRIIVIYHVLFDRNFILITRIKECVVKGVRGRKVRVFQRTDYSNYSDSLSCIAGADICRSHNDNDISIIMERIICAAIVVDTPLGQFELTGLRHNDVIASMIDILSKHNINPLGLPQLQGFKTSENRFVDRTEALKIAKLANQLLHPVTEVRNILYSEDIY